MRIFTPGGQMENTVRRIFTHGGQKIYRYADIYI